METRSSPGRHAQKIQVDKYIYQYQNDSHWHMESLAGSRSENKWRSWERAPDRLRFLLAGVQK